MRTAAGRSRRLRGTWIVAVLVGLFVGVAAMSAPQARAETLAAGSAADESDEAEEEPQARVCQPGDGPSLEDVEAPSWTFGQQGLVDCYGYPIWAYKLHFDTRTSVNTPGPGDDVARAIGIPGLEVPDPGRVIRSEWTKFNFSIIQINTSLASYVMSVGKAMPLLDLLAPVARGVNDFFRAVVDEIGIVFIMVSIAVTIGLLWIARGRRALGVWELSVSLVVAGLLGTAWFNPYEAILGPKGAVHTSHQIGTELAYCMAAGPESGECKAGSSDGSATVVFAGNGGPAVQQSLEDGAGYENVLGPQIVDTMVRRTHQELNFGRVLDGSSDQACIDNYNNAVAESAKDPDAGGEQIFAAVTGNDVLPQVVEDWLPGWGVGAIDRVTPDGVTRSPGECADFISDAAGDPGWSTVIMSWFLGFASTALLLFAVAGALTLTWYSFLAVVHFIQLIPNMVMAILPGRSREGLWRTLGDLFATCFLLIIHVVVIQAVLLAANASFAADTENIFGSHAWTLGLMFIAGLVLLRRLDHHRREMSEAIGYGLNWRPKKPGEISIRNHPRLHGDRMPIKGTNPLRWGAGFLGKQGRVLANETREELFEAAGKKMWVKLGDKYHERAGLLGKAGRLVKNIMAKVE